MIAVIPVVIGTLRHTHANANDNLLTVHELAYRLRRVSFNRLPFAFTLAFVLQIPYFKRLFILKIIYLKLPIHYHLNVDWVIGQAKTFFVYCGDSV